MIPNVSSSKLRPVGEMLGEDDDETLELQSMLGAARGYIKGFAWCHGIEDEFFGLGIGGVVAVFLFHIRAEADVDDWLWVIAGDLPFAYLVVDNAGTPTEALQSYCSLMDDWVRVVRSGGSIDDVFPVAAEATVNNADLLEKRIAFLRREVIPAFSQAN